MSLKLGRGLSRRLFVASGISALATPALAQATREDGLLGTEQRPTHNFFSYRGRDWRGYFDNLRKHAILVDIDSRALHFWHEDGETYRIYPTSVPLTEDLTRRGRTTVVRKVDGPEWRPTPSMLKRNPDLPEYIGPGPENPLGTHALYLGWTYYRIHGTNDIRKIGRQSSSGCIGLYNEHIVDIFGMAKVGTQVLLI